MLGHHELYNAVKYCKYVPGLLAGMSGRWEDLGKWLLPSTLCVGNAWLLRYHAVTWTMWDQASSESLSARRSGLWTQQEGSWVCRRWTFVKTNKQTLFLTLSHRCFNCDFHSDCVARGHEGVVCRHVPVTVTLHVVLVFQWFLNTCCFLGGVGCDGTSAANVKL